MLLGWCTSPTVAALLWTGLGPEGTTAFSSQKYSISLQHLLLLKPWGKIWGNSNRRAWQQDAWIICPVTKYLKLCELCRDSSNCQMFSVFLSVQDGKNLQILSCENTLASRHVVGNLLFLSDQCWVGARFNLRAFVTDLVDVFKWQTYIHCPYVNRAIIKSLSGYWTGIYTTADTGNFLP